MRWLLGVVLSFAAAAALAVLAGPPVLDLLASAVLSRIDPPRPPQDPWAVLAGALLGAVLVAWRRPSWFWHTWVHEHCHLAACLILGARVRGLMASDGRGGAVDFDSVDPVRGALIAIAPYTLPLVLLPLLLIQEAAPAGAWRQAISGLAALAAVTHVQGLWHNVRINISGEDSDLVRVGRPLALVLIALVLALVAVAVLAVLWGDPLRDAVAALLAAA